MCLKLFLFSILFYKISAGIFRDNECIWIGFVFWLGLFSGRALTSYFLWNIALNDAIRSFDATVFPFENEPIGPDWQDGKWSDKMTLSLFKSGLPPAEIHSH